MPGPISPSEVPGLKATIIPEGVFEAFNELIARSMSNGHATVWQSEAVALICERMGVTEGQILSEHWLDVEDAYRAQGWLVNYDKPGFNESYAPSFKFSASYKA
jgi:hypothetical protein